MGGAIISRMEKWVKLTTVWGEPKALLLKGFLEGEGIQVRLRYHVPPAVYPLTVDGLAEVQILVPEEDLLEARGGPESLSGAAGGRCAGRLRRN
jgi:hypothetical protein